MRSLKYSDLKTKTNLILNKSYDIITEKFKAKEVKAFEYTSF
mgnify:CR=1 FL=1